MPGKPSGDDPLGRGELSRRELIRRIAVGSAFALPVVGSFDLASLGVSSAYANAPDEPPYAPSFTSADAATFTIGVAQAFSIVTPGAAPVIVSQTGALPAGVQFTAIDGNYNPDDNIDARIAGTAAAGTSGVYPITLHVINETSSATQAFTLTVTEAPAFTSAATATLSTAADTTVNVTTSGQPSATVSLSGTLPPGMTFTANPSSGTASISGKPGAPGVYTLTLTASNGSATVATQTLVLTVQEPPAFTSGASATFSPAASSRFEIKTSAQPEATISLSGALPSGVAFAADPATGTAVLSGKPAASAAGTHPLTLTASNGVPPVASQSFVLTVAPSGVFTISDVKTGSTTELTFDVKVPGPGKITATVTAPSTAAAAAVGRKVKATRLTVASTRVSVKRAETLKVTTKPNSAGRRWALSKAHRDAELWLMVTYTPTGGTADTHTVKNLRLK